MYSKFTIHGNLPMIQIQDDSINQSVASTSQAVSDAPTAPNLNQSPISPASAAAPAENADKVAEIDSLLAELDRLSKNLEEKPAAKPETVSEAVPETVSEMAPNDDKKPEKFDFDSFLTDLETKIDATAGPKTDAPTENNTKEPMTDFPDSGKEFEDFRKNRSAVDVQSNSEDNKPSNQGDKENTEEDLKAQNIFEMLGLMGITDDEKNQFLDELEAMIWDDFVVHDLELLLTSEEYAGARKIIDDRNQKDEEKKENLIVYLEKLIPDLDEVLYDKALELKSEMMGERLAKMKDNADESTLSKVKEAEKMISQNLWKSAASLLNQLG